jgi:hypothetical protein
MYLTDRLSTNLINCFLPIVLIICVCYFCFTFSLFPQFCFVISEIQNKMLCVYNTLWNWNSSKPLLRSWTFVERITVLQLVKKSVAVYETRRSITVFIRLRH